MIKVKKANIVYLVDEKDLQSYLNDGFEKVELKKTNKKEEVKEKEEKDILPPKGKEEVKEKEKKEDKK